MPDYSHPSIREEDSAEESGTRRREVEVNVDGATRSDEERGDTADLNDRQDTITDREKPSGVFQLHRKSQHRTKLRPPNPYDRIDEEKEKIPLTDEQHVERNLALMFKDYAKWHPNKTPGKKSTFDDVQNKSDSMSLKAWLAFYQDIVSQSSL